MLNLKEIKMEEVPKSMIIDEIKNFSSFTCPNNFDEYLSYVLPKTNFNYIYVSKQSVKSKYQRNQQSQKKQNKRKWANPRRKENITDITTNIKNISSICSDSATKILCEKKKAGAISNHKKGFGKKTANQKLNPLNANSNHIKRKGANFCRKSLPKLPKQLLSNHHSMLNLNFLKMKRKKEDSTANIICSKKKIVHISDSDSNDKQFIQAGVNIQCHFLQETQLTNINQHKDKFPLDDNNEDIFSSSKNCVICGWIYPKAMSNDEKNAHMNFCIEGTGEQHKENYIKSMQAVNFSKYSENSVKVEDMITNDSSILESCFICGKEFKCKNIKAIRAHISNCMGDQDGDNLIQKRKIDLGEMLEKF